MTAADEVRKDPRKKTNQKKKTDTVLPGVILIMQINYEMYLYTDTILPGMISIINRTLLFTCRGMFFQQ